MYSMLWPQKSVDSSASQIKATSMRFVSKIIAGLTLIMAWEWMEARSSCMASTIAAKVYFVEGKVDYALAGSNDFKPLRKDQSLLVGTVVRAGEGEAVITTTPGTAIRVDKQTTLVLDHLAAREQSGKVIERKVLVDLRSGTVSALIDKDVGPADFKIKTPQGVATARGTFFAVSALGGQSYMGVKEGKVSVAVAQKQKYTKR